MRGNRHYEEEGRPMREGRGGRGGAQTFRRKRALAFLETLQTQEAVLVKQLQSEELQAVNAMIAGELKAVQTIKAQFIDAFQLNETSEQEEV